LTAYVRDSIVGALAQGAAYRTGKEMRNFRDFRALTRTALSLIAAGAFAADFGCSCLVAKARPIVPAERRYDSYDGTLPACGDPQVFERIQSRFSEREGEFWQSGLRIVSFGEPRETGMRSNGLDYIPRRYCMATAYFSDQSTREVTYSIVEDDGIIGLGFGVDWCVSGLDRNYAAAPDCSMAGP
jgi:hypothetical protein